MKPPEESVKELLNKSSQRIPKDLLDNFLYFLNESQKKSKLILGRVSKIILEEISGEIQEEISEGALEKFNPRKNTGKTIIGKVF